MWMKTGQMGGKVAVAHEGADFQNLKVAVLPCLDTAVNLSFPIYF
jgi:hypothetical protein